MLNGGQRRFIDVGARNVPARREARFVQNQRPLRIGDRAITMAHKEPARRLADIDAMVAIIGVAHDSLVFFVEGVDAGPCERDALRESALVFRQLALLPCTWRRALLASTHRVPGCEATI